VLLDVMLDDEMDGFDVLSHLKSHAETAGIPVIMLTADLRDEQKDRALEMGAVDYMTKPYNAKELILHVRRYLANP
jgi:DNA-binding response OmpR family regulator